MIEQIASWVVLAVFAAICVFYFAAYLHTPHENKYWHCVTTAVMFFGAVAAGVVATVAVMMAVLWALMVILGA